MCVCVCVCVYVCVCVCVCVCDFCSLVSVIDNIVSVVFCPVSVINNIVAAAVVIVVVVVVFLLWDSFGGKDFPSVCVN